MTVINPCRGCPLREGCDQRDVFRKKVAGLGMISANFRCDKLGAEVRVGRRIVIEQPIAGESDSYGERTIGRRDVKATIAAVDRRYRFSAIVDPGQIAAEEVADETKLDQYRFRKRMGHHRIRGFLDEPDGLFCEAGNLKRGNACDRLMGDCMCAAAAEIAKDIAA